ncbi:ABC transporter ATP-binding protein [Bradyrhizobium elkanii]|uniref:ABC transporter ATP-binding protein n=2 Tax=Bradyrhizobium TaxID=374 RepID=UPI000483458E|nr:ABC transporter ATP-binding protein [Bradyrhizobium elkanii]RZN33597.1 ABC transporter ATP-binding protein [Bradyrhizobium sp. Leo121]
MLELQKLVIRYGDFLAVDGVDMTVKQGEIVGIIGPNGAGKTSLLNAAAGLVRPFSGSVRFGADLLEDATPDVRLAHGLVLVPEVRGVFPMMSVHENLLVGAYLCRSTQEVARRIERVHRLFPILKDRRAQMVGTMSGGQQQMVAIASGLMASPKLLMLDEPSIGLAPVIIKEIGRTLGRLRDEGLTILLSEQNAKLATAIADRIYVVQAGRIQMARTTESLLDDPKFVESFLSLS